MIQAEIVNAVTRAAATGTAVPRIRRLIVGLALRGALDGDAPAESPSAILARFAAARESAIKNGKMKRPPEPSTSVPAVIRGFARCAVERLSNLAIIQKGATGIQGATPGRYPLVVTAEARASCDHFDFEGPAAIVPLVSSTGHGHASIQRLHYQEGQFALGNILCAIFPLLPEQLSARFLYEYLTAFKQELLVASMVGTANVSLTLARVGEVPVPLVSATAQRRVDELMALLDDLEAKRAKRQKVQGRLRTAALGAVTSAEEPEEFAAAWKRVAENWSVLFERAESVEEARSLVRELAIRGGLTSSVRQSLAPPCPIAAAKTRRPEVLPESVLRERLNTLAFTLPAGWSWVRMDSLAIEEAGAIGAGPFGTIFKARDFRDEGVPIIFLRHVAPGRYLTKKPGFMDRQKWEELFRPYSVWGGELLVTKLGDPPGVCAIYPEGIGPAMVTPDVIKMTVDLDLADPRYLMTFLNSETSRRFAFRSAYGLTRSRMNLPIFRDIPVPLPPLDEQRHIVAKVEQMMFLCEELEAKFGAKEVAASNLVAAVVKELTV